MQTSLEKYNEGKYGLIIMYFIECILCIFIQEFNFGSLYIHIRNDKTKCKKNVGLFLRVFLSN